MNPKHDQPLLDIVESRWRPWSERPHQGEVFAARRRAEVFPRLFIMRDDGTSVGYYACEGTIIGDAWEVFTHWMPVGEKKA